MEGDLTLEIIEKAIEELHRSGRELDVWFLRAQMEDYQKAMAELEKERFLELIKDIPIVITDLWEK